MRPRLLALLVPLLALGCTQAASPGTGETPAPCANPLAGQSLVMQSQSMHPTIELGDVILLEQRPPAFGDIVAFIPPRSWTTDPTPFVKRVVGTAGDDINLVRGQVQRNGSVLDEPYALGATEISEGQSRWQVPDGQLFVMGDFREKSADSRIFGPVPVGQVLGVATWKCAPEVGKLTSG